MNKTSFHPRQLYSLIAMLLFSPLLRLIPGLPAALAGRVAWLCPLCALPFLLLYMRFLCLLLRCRREGEGLPELSLRILGEKPGRLVLLLYAAWFLLYTAFALRTGAERLMITCYPRSSAAPFLVCLGLVVLVGALGSPRSLVRLGRLLLPFFVGILCFLLLFALFGAHRANLFPLTVYDSPALLKGALPVLSTLSGGLFLSGFLLGHVSGPIELEAPLSRWLASLCVLLTLLSAAILGNFGAELSADLAQPFFSLVRNLVFFQSLERTEALMVSLWLFPDFLLAATSLYVSQFCLRLALKQKPYEAAPRRFSLRDGRWLIPLCAVIAVVIALLMAPEGTDLRLWSLWLIPGGNLFFCFALLPLLALIAKNKKLL